jgi:hypothetical protein
MLWQYKFEHCPYIPGTGDDVPVELPLYFAPESHGYVAVSNDQSAFPFT